MARDLVNRHLSKGLAKSDVVRLLGAPDKSFNSNKETGASQADVKETCSYHLGAWHSHGLRNAFVCVYSDAAELVVGAEIAVTR